jgi:hypothetical protein
MIFSINRIEKLFKKFCTEQEPNYLRTYKVGNFLDAISEKKTQYPIAVVDFLDGNFDKLQTNINIVVTIGDRVLNDESNVYEVFSNNLQVGRDLYTFLNQYKEQFAITSASYRRFLEKSGDMLAGYVFTFQLKILDIECAYEVPIAELECLDAHLTINEIPTLTLVSGETKSISVTLDGNPSGTYNALTDTWELVSEPCPPSEITFTFDNNLIAVVDTSPYNIDCSTYLNMAIVTGGGLDGNYMDNGFNQYILDNVDQNRISYDSGDGSWVMSDRYGNLLAQANTGNEPYPWLATWSTITVEEGTIANYCGGGVCADATVTVNGDAFDTVESGEIIDVPVEYENGTPVGSIVSGVVEIPNPIAYNSINVLEYTADDNYVPPSNLAYAEVFCVGGGGGGGGGAVGIIGVVISGGGGGGGACTASKRYLPNELSPSNSIVIGLGGAGGGITQNTTTATNGTVGVVGGNTTFRVAEGSNTIVAVGGLGATFTTVGTAGAGRLVVLNTPPSLGLSTSSQGGGQGGFTGGAGVASTQIGFAGQFVYGVGGAGGGGIPAAGGQNPGGAGGRGYNYLGTISPIIAGGGAGGGAGNNGTNNVMLQVTRTTGVPPNTLGVGVAASGGGSSNVLGVVGGKGGNGGYGSGGAGGGAGLVGVAPNASGAGGDGGQGFCIIIEYLF